VAAGMALGVGSVLAFTLSAALQSASARPGWRRVARALGVALTPPLRRLDRWLPHGTDAAGGCWFLGTRREGPPVRDRDLVRDYRADFGSRLTLPPHAPSR